MKFIARGGRSLLSARPEYNHFQCATVRVIHIPNLPASHLPTPWKGNPHQPLAPPSAMPPTTKLAPAGQKHFFDFGCYRWGESHSPCFIFSRNFTDVASRTSITISPRLRPGLPSMLSWDCVPGYHRYAQYCLPCRQTPPSAPWNARSAYYTIEDKYR